jgi:hypothetical protein
VSLMYGTSTYCKASGSSGISLWKPHPMTLIVSPVHHGFALSVKVNTLTAHPRWVTLDRVCITVIITSIWQNTRIWEFPYLVRSYLTKGLSGASHWQSSDETWIGNAWIVNTPRYFFFRHVSHMCDGRPRSIAFESPLCMSKARLGLGRHFWFCFLQLQNFLFQSVLHDVWMVVWKYNMNLKLKLNSQQQVMFAFSLECNNPPTPGWA